MGAPRIRVGQDIGQHPFVRPIPGVQLAEPVAKPLGGVGDRFPLRRIRHPRRAHPMGRACLVERIDGREVGIYGVPLDAGPYGDTADGRP